MPQALRTSPSVDCLVHKTSIPSSSTFLVKRQILLIMEATTMASKPMPSQAKLALAMAIVKQKPAGMDIQG
jgi:hypothetical protein